MSPGDVSAEQGKRNKSSGANSEPLADRSGGVARGVQGVCAIADMFAQLGHLGDSTRVIAHGAVRVDGQTRGKIGKHT